MTASLREAAQQALEALTNLHRVCKQADSKREDRLPSAADYDAARAAAGIAGTALRAALEAPEAAVVQARSDMLTLLRDKNFRMSGGSDFALEIVAALTPAVGALPVATGLPNFTVRSVYVTGDVWLCRADDECAPVALTFGQQVSPYAVPQPLPSLTDDEIRAAWNRTQEPVAMVRELMGAKR